MEIAANLCPISQPLEIIQEIIKNNTNENLCEMIQEHFSNVILTEEAEKMIPSDIHSAQNGSLLKIIDASIIQDCVEDEFYQPIIKTKSDSVVNSGLWTRSIYDPNGHLDGPFDPDYSKLQVRKRLLAICKRSGKSFILALYREKGQKSEEEWEKMRQETFKMNSLHRFIGIYEAAEEIEDAGADFVGESLPTIHLLKRSEHVFEGLVPIETELAADLEGIRARLIEYLTGCLKGNRLAAENLILSLVSRPSMRVDGLVDSLFIGKLSLNLCVKNGQRAAEELETILKGLKPFVAGPIKIESNPEGSFTKESIYPRLDVQSGQLRAGAVLQQPDGCVLIIDETELSVGEFKDQAVCNLQALIDLIRQQHVNYDFGMQQVALKTDMPVIGVSLEKKSVLPFDLKADCDGIEAVKVDPVELNIFRSYLHHCRLLNCSVSEEMATFLEQDYLNLRKTSPVLPNGNPKMNEQEFHRLMNLARLSSVSRGQSQLSKEIWEQTKSLYNN